MSDCVVIGGGVIGLSLAFELAGHGLRVRVIDAGQPGREASWAGAGILPPACATSDDPLERLTALSNELHQHWAAELRALVGMDNGYRRSGAIYLARDPDESGRLDLFAQLAQARKMVARRLSLDELSDIEPGLQPCGTTLAAYLVPDECQIRNPRHLKALALGCAARGVEITAGVSAEDFEIRGQRVRSVRTNIGPLVADQFCVATGCWTGALARRLRLSLAIKPVRGQMVLLSMPRLVVGRVINEGSRYLVPRDDGRVLCGSTEEDVGFDRGTTAGAISDLMELAIGLVPQLAEAQVERYWAGLRPATDDALPYLGRAGELENAYVAAGHFRSGLQLSTGTAVVMSQLIRGQQPDIDLAAFSPCRKAAYLGEEISDRRAPREVPLR